MEKNEVPGGTTYQFLWLCVKHNTRAQVSTDLFSLGIFRNDRFTNDVVATKLERHRCQSQHYCWSGIKALLPDEESV